MPTLVNFNGVNYNIPLPGETGWGDQVNAFLVAVAAAALVSGSTVTNLTVTNLTASVLSHPVTTQVVAASDTILPTTSNIVVSALSAVTANTTTSITSGTTVGQKVIITGSGAFPITIQDGSNTTMNGDIVLNSGESIEFKWDATLKWVEQRRSN